MTVRLVLEARLVLAFLVRSRVRKRALTGALVVVGAAALYLVAMNVFLRTRLFRNAIGADPGSLLVEYTSAYSIVPGRIHVEGLMIRGRDSNVEWTLELGRCDFRISITELLHKEFHATHVAGEGLSLRLRRRRDAVTPEEMKAMAPVPGFIDPPLTDVGPPPPPLTDRTYNLWSVRLDDVDAKHVREIWIDTVRYTGDLEVRGSWLFRPLRWLEVGPAVVNLQPLGVSYGMIEPWASSVVGTLEITVAPFDLREVHGADVLNRISIAGRLSGTIHAANPVTRLTHGMSVASADVPIDARIELDHGVLRPGTTVTSEPFDARVSAEGLSFDAALKVDVRVDEGGRGSATMACSTVRVSQQGDTRARADRIVATVASRELDLARPFSDATYAADVENAQTDSLRFWRTRVAMPENMSVDSGVATGGAHVQGRVADETTGRPFETFTGALTASVDGLSIEMKDMNARTNLVAQVTVREGRWRGGRIEASGSLSLRTLTASAKGVSARIPALEVRADGRVTDDDGFVGKVSVDAPDIELPALAKLGEFVAFRKFLSIERGSARGTARADFDVGQGSGTGSIRMVTQNLRAHIGAETLDGVLRIAITAKERGPVLDLSGSTIAFTGQPGVQATDWWGRVELREAAFHPAKGPRFEARVSAQAQDASPIVALIESTAPVPSWIVDVVSTKEFDASGEIVIAPSTFEARSVNAHGAGVDAALEYASRGAEKEWALFLGLGLLGAGIHVAHGGTEVVLFGAKAWFDEKVALLRASERKDE